jgi:predicted nucleic acid-binding protein
LTAVAVKYALDTNLIIDAVKNVDGEQRLRAFHRRYAPFEYLSAVVAHELCAGARAPAEAARVARYFVPYERRGRVFAPSYETWKAAGAAARALRGSELTRSFSNDILLAASCREHGVTLVTKDSADFERIRRVLRFDFVAGWPAA